MLMLSNLLEALNYSRISMNDIAIVDAQVDSRKIIPGSLFIAIQGEHVDGHDFVSEAFNRGACAALIQHDVQGDFQVIEPDFSSSKKESTSHAPYCIKVNNTILALQQIATYWRAKLDVKVIGITGSVGKSTTKELVSEVLATKFTTLRNAGNLNNEIGLPITLLRLTEGYQRAVLEMGFYNKGEISLLCKIAKPSIGIITNIGTVHAERSGSQESIAQGKAELVEALPSDGIAILNYDDDWVRPMAALTQARVLFYGLNPKAHLWADHIESKGFNGIQFQVHFQNDHLLINVPLMGQHSVHTALRAIAAGLADNLSWGEIIQGLQSSTAQLRLIPSRTKSGAIILDDSYNASPDSSLAALDLLGSLEGRKIAVLGDMKELGPYEEIGHQKVGIRAAQVVDYLFTVGRLSKKISASAVENGFSNDKVFEMLEPQSVISKLNEILREGDIVLIKGSHSMHLNQIVAALEEES